MKFQRDKILGYVAGALFTCCYAGVSLSTSYLAGGKAIAEQGSILFLVFASAAAVAALIGWRALGRLPRFRWADIAVLAVAGPCACSYFLVVAGIGAASADWLEKALTPLFLVAIAVAYLRQKQGTWKYLSLAAALAGYLYFVSKGPFNPAQDWKYFVVLSTLGALGSAVSVMFMKKMVGQELMPCEEDHRALLADRCAKENKGYLSALKRKYNYGTYAEYLKKVKNPILAELRKERLSKTVGARLWAISIRYGVPAVLVLGCLAIRGEGQMPSSSVASLGAVMTGGILINLAIFLALIVIDKLGSSALAVLFVLEPLLTLLGTRVFDLPDKGMGTFGMPVLVFVVMVLAGQGLDFLGDRREENNKARDHDHWKAIVVGWLAHAGIQVSMENTNLAGFTDIIVRGTATSAIEIETDESSWRANVDKNLEKGFARVLVVATNQDAYDSIAKELDGKPDAVVRLMLAAGLTQSDLLAAIEEQCLERIPAL